MKKLFSILILLLGMAACQTPRQVPPDNGKDINKLNPSGSITRPDSTVRQ